MRACAAHRTTGWYLLDLSEGLLPLSGGVLSGDARERAKTACVNVPPFAYAAKSGEAARSLMAPSNVPPIPHTPHPHTWCASSIFIFLGYRQFPSSMSKYSPLRISAGVRTQLFRRVPSLGCGGALNSPPPRPSVRSPPHHTLRFQEKIITERLRRGRVSSGGDGFCRRGAVVVVSHRCSTSRWSPAHPSKLANRCRLYTSGSVTEVALEILHEWHLCINAMYPHMSYYRRMLGVSYCYSPPHVHVCVRGGPASVCSNHGLGSYARGALMRGPSSIWS